MTASRFAGRRVLVTGAARGVGRAAADAFHREGAEVAYVDLDEVAVTTAAGDLDDERAFGLRCDVRSATDAERAVRETCERFGGLDHLVNAAGVLSLARCADLAEDEWDRVMDVNAKGVFLMMKAAIPAIARSGGGAIVNIASQAGKRAEAEAAHYCASKAAVIMLTRSVALEVAPAIRVNSVCPGYVDTDMQTTAADDVARLTGTTRAAVLDEMLAEIPLRRFQQPEDVARVVTFLASDDASEITGEDVNITGGLTMY